MDESVLERFRRDPARSGLFLDFDGTLSEIVRVPSEARPLSGVKELLGRLAERYGLVAIVSGRAAAQLLQWLGSSVEIWGLHGAERTIDDSIVLCEPAARYRELMAAVREEAAARLAELGLRGVILEDKTVMLGLHFRAATDVGRARRELEALVADLAARHGLTHATGRLAFELRAPVEFSKGAVVLDRSRELGLRAVAFVGDDAVDLPAFDALDVLDKEGVATVRVAVRSSEAPAELLARADLVVDGPAGAVDLLKRLG